jgi:hypothetical protein
VPLCPCDRKPTLSHLEFLFGSLLARAAGLGPEAQAPPCVDWRFPAWHKAPTHRLALAVLLVAILVTLVPLAHSSPPDPTLVAGVWDNADYDDVVALATVRGRWMGEDLATFPTEIFLKAAREMVGPRR